MYQGVFGASSVSRSKGYQEVSNVYQVYQRVLGVSNGIECIKEYHGASSVSRSKGYHEVSNVYQVY